MKSVIFIGLVILIACIGLKAWRYSKQTSTEKLERITTKMARKLGLDDKQKAKVFELNKTRMEGHHAAYKAGRNKQMITASVQQWQTDLKAVLNPDQQKKLKL